MDPFTSPLLLGLDSAFCCVAIGTAPLAWSTRLKLALAFGVCDAAASALGSIFAYPFPAPPALAIYLCCAVLLGFSARNDRRLINALPFVLSLDNLVAGGGLYSALPDGFASATLALFGLCAGAIIFRLLSGGWPQCSETTQALRRSDPLISN